MDMIGTSYKATIGVSNEFKFYISVAISVFELNEDF
jgi:hypothetical protein